MQDRIEDMQEEGRQNRTKRYVDRMQDATQIPYHLVAFYSYRGAI